MQTPFILPVKLVHIPSGELFHISQDIIFFIIKDTHVHIGKIYRYTRKGFYYIDLFGNKSYITWSNFDDVNKKDDENLPNQLPLFPDTEQI